MALASGHAVRKAVSPYLADGEQLRLVTRAIPVERDPGTAFGLPAAFPLLWLSRRAARAGEASDARRQGRIATAPRMLLAVTDSRLLVLATRRDWTPKLSLGERPISAVGRVENNTVGTGWRTVTFSIEPDQQLTLRVSHRAIEPLAAVLDRRG